MSPAFNSKLKTQNSKLVIGLVGGMGSGKSLVAEEFARHGGRVVAGDPIGHEGLRQPDIRDQVVRRWGRELLNEHGDIDRRKLAAVVFADPMERKKLEDLLFPWIKQRIREEVATAKDDPAVRFVVLDAAVMLEAGWYQVCDHLIFVDAPRDVRIRRLAEQRGWSAKEVEARENAQMSLSEKRSHADCVLDNSQSREHLARQVEDLLKQWKLIRD